MSIYFMSINLPSHCTPLRYHCQLRWCMRTFGNAFKRSLVVFVSHPQADILNVRSGSLYLYAIGWPYRRMMVTFGCTSIVMFDFLNERASMNALTASLVIFFIGSIIIRLVLKAQVHLCLICFYAHSSWRKMSCRKLLRRRSQKIFCFAQYSSHFCYLQIV